MKSMRQQFADTMLSLGREDGKLIVLVGDISHFILQPFADACPGRYYNIGICEQTIVSMAAGLSKMGFFPVVHTIAPFLLERSYEQIKLDFCYQQLPGNLVTVGSLFDYSNLGITHHCYGDFGLLKLLPHTQIIYPASAVEFDTLFRQAYNNDSLTLYRLPCTQHEQKIDAADVEVGKGLKIRDGTDLTVIATGPHLKTAMDSVDGLLGMGLNPEILYIHTIRPLDAELILTSIQKTRSVLVIEEHMEMGGLGDDVLRLTRGAGNTRHASLSIPNEFMTGYGTYQEQCERAGFTVDGVMRKVKRELL